MFCVCSGKEKQSLWTSFQTWKLSLLNQVLLLPQCSPEGDQHRCQKAENCAGCTQKHSSPAPHCQHIPLMWNHWNYKTRPLEAKHVFECSAWSGPLSVFWRGVNIETHKINCSQIFLPPSKTGRMKSHVYCIHTCIGLTREREASGKSSLLALEQQHTPLIKSLLVNMQNKEAVLFTVFLSVQTLSCLQTDLCIW